MQFAWVTSLFMLFNFLLVLLICVMGIYGFILFVKLARRGIKALDIYIEKNSSKD